MNRIRKHMIYKKEFINDIAEKSGYPKALISTIIRLYEREIKEKLVNDNRGIYISNVCRILPRLKSRIAIINGKVVTDETQCKRRLCFKTMHSITKQIDYGKEDLSKC